MIQEILAFITLSIAVVFYSKILYKKEKANKNCGSDNCECH